MLLLWWEKWLSATPEVAFFYPLWKLVSSWTKLHSPAINTVYLFCLINRLDSEVPETTAGGSWMRKDGNTTGIWLQAELILCFRTPLTQTRKQTVSLKRAHPPTNHCFSATTSEVTLISLDTPQTEPIPERSTVTKQFCSCIIHI